MRALRPDRVFFLPSGLWVLDAVQPVAAVLDPASGAVRRVVSWRQLPPAAGPERWPAPRAFSDGSCLWTQQQACGPLVRVDPGGAVTAAWTGGLLLAACGPEAAWCGPRPPHQELVAGVEPHPVRQLGGDRLLRVAADGACTTVRTEQPVRDVRADTHGLLVQVDVEGWTLRSLGADIYEVLRPSRWLRLPWDARLPETLTVAGHGLAADFVPAGRVDGGGWGPFFWHEDPTVPDGTHNGGKPFDPDHGTLVALGLSWRFGWDLDLARSGTGRQALASAHTMQGKPVRRWNLGPGGVQTVTPVGEHLAVVLSRNQDPGGSPAGGSVLLLDPTTGSPATTLLADDSIDITEGCWPLPPRPVDTDSYLAQTLAANHALEHFWHSEPDSLGKPLAAGMSEVRTALVGDWPRTHLEWTFSYAPYAGLVLRRRTPLFDELGRPDPPHSADINLMEDLDTKNLPPASTARSGVLDV